MHTQTHPNRRHGPLAWAFGAAFAISMASGINMASAQTAEWDDLVGQLDALVEEAAAADIRMGISLIDLSGAFDNAATTVGDAMPYKAASVIKLPLLALLMDLADQGELSLDEMVAVPAGDINIVGGAGSLEDREFPLDIDIRELMTLMVQESDNTATNILIDRVGGFAAVNAYIGDLGYTNMWFGRKMMNSAVEPLQQNWINPTEAADLIAKIYNHEILSAESSEFIIDLMKGQLVNTKFGAVIPREVLANKTGELGDVSHDTGIILLPDHEVVLAVMTAFESMERSEVDLYVQRAATIVYEFLLGAMGE